MEDIKTVALYIPNVIGYIRIILAIGSFYTMSENPYPTFFLYMVSCLLDAFDGQAARYFNQCSKYGSILDMVIDRTTTGCLLLFLGSRYPNYILFFQCLLSLDFASHYFHIFKSLTVGAESHKKIDKNQNWLLKLYYHNNKVLFTLCASQEIFLMSLYLLSFDNYYIIWIIAGVSFPGFALKQFMSLVQMFAAAKEVLRIDIEEKKKKK